MSNSNELDVKEVMAAAGRQSEIMVRLCQAIMKNGAPPTILNSLITPGNEAVFSAIVDAVVDNALPLVAKYCVKTGWSRGLIRPEASVFQNLQQLYFGLGRGGMFDGSIDYGLLEKHGDLGFADQKEEKVFSIVRFWKGWSLDKVLTMADGMGLKVPSALDMIHFVPFLSGKLECNWNLIPTGYAIHNVLAISKPVSLASDFNVLPTIQTSNRSVLLGYMPCAAKLLQTSGPNQVNGFGTALPFLFVDKDGS